VLGGDHQLTDVRVGIACPVLAATGSSEPHDAASGFGDEDWVLIVVSGQRGVHPRAHCRKHGVLVPPRSDTGGQAGSELAHGIRIGCGRSANLHRHLHHHDDAIARADE
jgi:hypothetical protein